MGIEGRWSGHYYQSDYRQTKSSASEDPECVYLIEAEFEVEGTSLTGTMTDLTSTRERLYAEIVANIYEGMNWRERKRAGDLLKKRPDCRYRVSLFSESALFGTIAGNQVNFTKTYLGPCETTFSFGKTEQITRRIDQEIFYYGELCESGNLIAGTYELPGQPAKGRQTFELRRCE